jgi:hypothetical protein
LRLLADQAVELGYCGRLSHTGSSRFDVRHKGIRIIAFVGQHGFGLPLAQQWNRLCAVGHLSGRDHEVQRLTQLVTQQVNLGR